MPRTTQAARKQIGGIGLRKELAAISKRRSIPTSSPPKPEEPGLQLGHVFSHEAADACNDVTHAPTFDMNDTNQVKKFMPGFIVRREPNAIRADAMDSTEKNLLRNSLKSIKNKHPKASFAVVWRFDNGKTELITETSRKCPAPYKELKQMLATGQLNGCDLRGNKETGQFGIVANRNLAPETPIAIETGLLWSENKHEEILQGKSFTDGIASVYVPADTFKSLVVDEVWSDYTEMHGDDQGFVIDSSRQGGPTKHIDDPCWIHAAGAKAARNPNLESHLVFDLERNKMTVCFFVKENTHIQSNQELLVDWGCWEKIADLQLPGGALLMQAENAKMLELQADCERRNIEIPDFNEEIEEAMHALEPHFYSRSDVQVLEMEEGPKSRPVKLEVLGRIVASRDDQSEPARKLQKQAAFEQLEEGQVSYTSRDRCFGILPTGCQSHLLSDESRTALSQIRASTPSDVEVLLGTRDFSHLLEVVELTDPENPSFLLTKPDEKAYGLISKRRFTAGEMVGAYGGPICDTGDEEMDEAFLFDLDLSKYYYQGRKLFINGIDGIFGKANCAWSPKGMKQREPNLKALLYFDERTKTPQIVFQATKTIEQNEELLYHYGLEYWKSMWIKRMTEFADVTARTALYNRNLLELIYMDKKKASKVRSDQMKVRKAREERARARAAKRQSIPAAMQTQDTSDNEAQNSETMTVTPVLPEPSKSRRSSHTFYRLPAGKLKFTLHDPSPTSQGHVWIRKVQKDSPLYGRVKENDWIIAINGEFVNKNSTAKVCASLLKQSWNGDRRTIHVSRCFNSLQRITESAESNVNSVSNAAPGVTSAHSSAARISATANRVDARVVTSPFHSEACFAMDTRHRPPED